MLFIIQIRLYYHWLYFVKFTFKSVSIILLKYLEACFFTNFKYIITEINTDLFVKLKMKTLFARRLWRKNYSADFLIIEDWKVKKQETERLQSYMYEIGNTHNKNPLNYNRAATIAFDGQMTDGHNVRLKRLQIEHLTYPNTNIWFLPVFVPIHGPFIFVINMLHCSKSYNYILCRNRDIFAVNIQRSLHAYILIFFQSTLVRRIYSNGNYIYRFSKKCPFWPIKLQLQCPTYFFHVLATRSPHHLGSCPCTWNIPVANYRI